MPTLIAVHEDEGTRVDSFLAAMVPEMSRSALKRLIDERCVTVNGKIPRASQQIKEGDEIEYSLPDIKPAQTTAEDIPLNVVYEDSDLVVLNKPRGMVVHPAPGAHAGTLVNALLAHCKGLSTIGGEERPGIVHRLDKQTSGLMVVAKNDAAHRHLQKQIQARTAIRKYLALVWGDPKFQQAEVDAPIGRHPADRKKMAVIETSDHKSREAVTDFRVLERFGSFTLLEAGLRTGRTHQVRVHASFAGYPVVGDEVYSGNRRMKTGRSEYITQVNKLIDRLQGQALHAYQLSFDHPKTGDRLEFTADMPIEMKSLVGYIRAQCGE